MTDEEINRRFELVAEHLASLAIGLQNLQETQRRAEERWERAEARWERTEGSIRALLAVQELQAGEIKELGEAVRVVDERQRQADQRAAEMDERLNALIDIVERYISGRNGQS